MRRLKATIISRMHQALSRQAIHAGRERPLRSPAPSRGRGNGDFDSAVCSYLSRHEWHKASLACEKFALNIGLAFQVADDILDVTASTEELGKTAAKDLDADKTTYPKLLGLDMVPAPKLYD